MTWDEDELVVPDEWERLNLEGLRGVLLVVGGTDVGKSTFTRYLYARLQRERPDEALAFVDGDPGQSRFGPPTTLTLVPGPLPESGFPPVPPARRYFIGSTTPSGHLLPSLVGAARLAAAAGEATVVYDTSGMIAPSAGGLALKSAKIELLRPAAVIAIQQESELQALLVPLRRSRRTQVISLRPAPEVRRRSREVRRRSRAGQFAAYFASAGLLKVDWTRLAIFPRPQFSLGRLAALEDREGFTLALGIVVNVDRESRRASLYTPLDTLEGVNALRLGDMVLDPETFEETRVG